MPVLKDETDGEQRGKAYGDFKKKDCFFARIALKRNPGKDENSSLLNCRRKIFVATYGLLGPVE